MTVTIYALANPETHEIRYIGQTSRQPTERLKEHLKLAREKSGRWYVCNWIRSLGELIPEVITLEVNPLEGADAAETRWIEKASLEGWKLTNMTKGGNTITRLGIPVSEETKEKLRKANLGKKQSEDTIAKRVNSLKGKVRSEEFKAHMAVKMKGKPPWNKGLTGIDKHYPTEETKQKISDGLKANRYGSFESLRDRARDLKMRGLNGNRISKELGIGQATVYAWIKKGLV